MATGVVKRAYKYRFYPTDGQAEQLGGAVERPTAGIVTAVAGCVRQVLAGAEPVSDVQKRGVSKDSATYFANCFAYRGLPDDVVPSQVTMSRNSRGQYHISILVETEIASLLSTEQTVGVDAGITSLFTLSTGEKIDNPRHEAKDRVRLAKAHRALAKKEKGSANRAKARLKVAKIYGRVADRRRDHLHQLSTRLVRENQVIAVETLSVRNMLKNRSLSRAISDAAWSEFRSMLEYKADWYGRRVVAIDRFYPSSKTCSVCGVVESLPLDVRVWTCRCGAHHDRDVNAAINILAVGLAVSACGDGVSPLLV